ncbi:4-hydroxy-tetrahydrodipicolinate synthase [Ruaniaceae bacterium KH17]|nr:4-hydroxy-tetrahydrodipicolinate synthase [Ruaniaceae bacterium KH17]
MSLREKLSGTIAPLFTPFTDSGDVDHESLRRMVRWQHANGSTGISIGGSTGEPSSQTIAERAEAIRTISEEIQGTGLSFVPGTGSAKLNETLELTAAAQEVGVDAALIITPYYARPTQEALYQWYATVAREFPDLPLIAYNVPSRTAVEMAPETFARLYRDFDNIVGIKETTKDFEHFSRTMYACGSDVLMWSGIELLCLPLLSLGGVGFISALSNIAPKAVAETYNAGVANDWDRARDLHYGVHPLVDLLFVETNPAPAKWLMAQRGLISSAHVRSPLIELTEAGQEKVLALAESASAYLTDVNI